MRYNWPMQLQAGHMINMEAPDAVNRLLEAHFRAS